jgi:RNA polymerase sigma-70 factor (TIGR02960 family)
VTVDLLDRARAGDGDAFRELVSPYQRELQVHCYRLLGSVQDAEDALQEALLAAWQGLAGFEARASIRTWLYRVVTSRCLNARRSIARRQGTSSPPGPEPPEPTRFGEVTWLQPCPDELLGGLADAAPGPEAQYETREAISLAFITAIQRLPPQQRAALILRDVLGYPASEAAAILAVTEDSVTSALKRARAAVRSGSTELTAPDSPGEKRLIEKLTAAYERGDVAGIIELFSDDAWLTMPPLPLEYQGRELIRQFLTRIAFRDGRTYLLMPTRANGQLALAAYLREPGAAGPATANSLLVLTLAGTRIQAMTRFDQSVFPYFGLPPVLVTS